MSGLLWWVAGGATALVVAAFVPTDRGSVVLRRTAVRSGCSSDSDASDDPGRPVGVHAVMSVCVAVVVGWAIPGTTGLVAALLAGGGAWWWTGQETVRRGRQARERQAADLPHLVGLVAVGVRAGAPVESAVAQASQALPGPAADLLGDAVRRLQWGEDPEDVWARVAAHPGTEPLGRALGRAARTGAGVVDVVEALADDLADRARAEREDRARAVGVRAAVPLGVCLLPAFLLLGIVPLVAGLVSSMTW